MLLSAVSVLVVAQSSSEIPEGLMNDPVYAYICIINVSYVVLSLNNSVATQVVAVGVALTFSHLSSN